VVCTSHGRAVMAVAETHRFAVLVQVFEHVDRLGTPVRQTV
jgi:hypothetical protein